MSSLCCSNFHLAFSQFVSVTYVTDCQRLTPRSTSLKRCGLKLSSRQDMSAKFPRGGSRSFSQHKVYGQSHTGQAAIANIKTIDECRSKIVRNIVFDCRLATNGNRKHCFQQFYPCSSIAKSVFDCRLPGVGPSYTSHTGQAAIGNVNTIDERRSKSLITQFSITDWLQMEIQRFLIRVRRLRKAFLIAAYLVQVQSTHPASVMLVIYLPTSETQFIP